MGGMCNSEKVVYQANIFLMKNKKGEKISLLEFETEVLQS